MRFGPAAFGAGDFEVAGGGGRIEGARGHVPLREERREAKDLHPLAHPTSRSSTFDKATMPAAVAIRYLR